MKKIENKSVIKNKVLKNIIGEFLTLGFALSVSFNEGYLMHNKLT